MRPDDTNRIRHMIEAAETARQFVAGRQKRDLDSDRMLLFALVRAVEIIGEAATRISPETRALAAAVPWALITAMRNRLVHAYFDIDHGILWKTVTEELPPLVLLLRKALPED
ncbi:MAG: DUF86 domain-containing protein [Magnetospirillum sp.]|nr:DUF86 domain-containing protein [Magnetospirillum sp.]